MINSIYAGTYAPKTIDVFAFLTFFQGQNRTQTWYPCQLVGALNPENYGPRNTTGLKQPPYTLAQAFLKCIPDGIEFAEVCVVAAFRGVCVRSRIDLIILAVLARTKIQNSLTIWTR